MLELTKTDLEYPSRKMYTAKALNKRNCTFQACVKKKLTVNEELTPTYGSWKRK